jgi:hypothetical protein
MASWIQISIVILLATIKPCHDLTRILSIVARLFVRTARYTNRKSSNVNCFGYLVV